MTTQKFLQFLASLDDAGRKVMDAIVSVDADALRDMVANLTPTPPPKLDLTLAIPTETGYELPTTGLAKILPPPPTYECPICYETGESHFQCPNGHTAACLPCLQHIYNCPICRLPIRDEFIETANETANETADETADSDSESEIDVNDIMEPDYDIALNDWRQSHFNQLDNDEINPTAIFDVELYETAADRRNNRPARTYKFKYAYTTPRCYVLKSYDYLASDGQPKFITKSKSFFRNFPHNGKNISLTATQRTQTNGYYIGKISLNYDDFHSIHTETYGY